MKLGSTIKAGQRVKRFGAGNSNCKGCTRLTEHTSSDLYCLLFLSYISLYFLAIVQPYTVWWRALPLLSDYVTDVVFSGYSFLLLFFWVHLIGSNKVEVSAIEFLAFLCYHSEKWRQFVSSLLARHCVCRLSFRSHCTGMRWQVLNERTPPSAALVLVVVVFVVVARLFAPLCSSRLSSFAFPMIGALIVTNGNGGSLAVLLFCWPLSLARLSPVSSGACLSVACNCTVLPPSARCLTLCFLSFFCRHRRHHQLGTVHQYYR